MSENRTNRRRAPRGAYAIYARKGRNGGATQYFITIPAHVAAPLYEADLAIVFDVVEGGVLMRPIPMQQGEDSHPGDEAARALVQRVMDGQV